MFGSQLAGSCHCLKRCHSLACLRLRLGDVAAMSGAHCDAAAVSAACVGLALTWGVVTRRRVVVVVALPPLMLIIAPWVLVPLLTTCVHHVDELRAAAPQMTQEARAAGAG
jgi:hypothetical protein